MQKLNISGYVLKLNVNTAVNGLWFSLTSFLKAETFVVCSAVTSSAKTGVSCSLKRLTRVFLTGLTKRMKSSQNLKNSVGVIRINDSPIEYCRGWSPFDLIASNETSLLLTQKLIYRRGVITW